MPHNRVGTEVARLACKYNVHCEETQWVPVHKEEQPEDGINQQDKPFNLYLTSLLHPIEHPIYIFPSLFIVSCTIFFTFDNFRHTN